MLERGSWTHILQPILEAVGILLVPLVADFDSTTTVVLECIVLGILTTNMHHMPDCIERIVREDGLALVTTVQLGRVRAHHVVFGNFLHLTTRTLAHPVQLLVRSLFLLVIRQTVH